MQHIKKYLMHTMTLLHLILVHRVLDFEKINIVKDFKKITANIHS